MEKLHLSDKTITKAFKELVKYNLIDEKKARETANQTLFMLVK